MEKEQEKGESTQNVPKQSGLVDMIVTPDNPIIINNRLVQYPDIEPEDQDDDDSADMMISQLEENVANSLVLRNQGQQQLALHSGATSGAAQLTPIDISGGQHFGAHFGPMNLTATKKVGIEGKNVTGNHFGPTNITVNLNKKTKKQLKQGWWKKKSKKSAPTKPVESERPDVSNPNVYQLSDSIWLFKDRPLSKKANIFEGEMRSGILARRQLAIKCFMNYNKRNIREANNLVKLVPHSNVVTIIHSDVYHGGPMECMYIAMERCNTMTLQGFIKTRKAKNVPFNLKLALKHIKQIVDAFHHIHSNNILHRDFKPSSVLFSLCGNYLKITDLGLSKELERGHSVTGLSTLESGVDAYRAPEIYNKDDSVSKMADIFSLALVLYYILSYGFHAFGLDPSLWIHNIKNGKACDLSRLRVPLLEIASSLLERMLKFDPKQRPNIDQVMNDQLMKLDETSALLESLKLVLSGAIRRNNVTTGSQQGISTESTESSTILCQLYQSPNLQQGQGIELESSSEANEQCWVLNMNTMPNPDIESLQKVTEEKPAGYLVTSSKDELKRIANELKREKQVGWIEMPKRQGKSKILLLLCPEDYPELFGFLLSDQEVLTSLIRGIVSKERQTSSQPLKDIPQHATAELKSVVARSQSNEIAQLVKQLPSVPDATEDRTGFPAAFPPMESEDTKWAGYDTSMLDDNVSISTDCRHAAVAASLISEVTQDRELVPWWIFTGAGDLHK